ncbi:MAG: hypothetical protein ACON4M_06295 [Crocinitomicaceae bacterium]
MKTTYLTLVLNLFLGLSYGQISIKELLDISYMNSEEFEISTMDRGYNFSSIIEKEYRKGISMKEKQSFNERELIWHSKYMDWDYAVYYYSAFKNELLEIYKELGELGFKLDSRSTDVDGDYVKRYRKDTEEFNIYLEIRIQYDDFYIWCCQYDLLNK